MSGKNTLELSDFKIFLIKKWRQEGIKQKRMRPD